MRAKDKTGEKIKAVEKAEAIEKAEAEERDKTEEKIGSGERLGAKRKIKIGERLAELIFPPSLYCICCGKYTDPSRAYSLCDHCIKRMNFTMTELPLREYDAKAAGFGKKQCGSAASAFGGSRTGDEEGSAAGGKDAVSPAGESNTPAFSAEETYLNSAAAAMGYGLYERQLIFGLKYGGKTYIARHIADILYDCLKKRLAETGDCPWLMADLITPVPLHREKLKERGFNQAAKIAFRFGKRTGIPLCAEGLERVRETTPQRALSAAERKANVSEAFRVDPAKAKLLRGKRVLLIDDIFTTGATARECAKCLKEAGATRVDFLALSSADNKAHTPPDEDLPSCIYSWSDDKII